MIKTLYNNNQYPSQENLWKTIVYPINIKSVFEECHDNQYFWAELVKDVTQRVAIDVNARRRLQEF